MEFYSKTISEGWELSIEYLLQNGSQIDSQRGMRTLEITNAVFHISNPLLEPMVSAKYNYSTDFVSKFVKDMEDDYVGVSIGERIYGYGEDRIDQVERIIEELRGDYFSRRAIISLWSPREDSISSHPPCPVLLQFYIRNGALNMTSVLRSSDAWMAAIPDMIALTGLLQKASERLAVNIGSYTQMSVSYHLYEKDLIVARELFNQS